jgi:hypothetical protein
VIGIVVVTGVDRVAESLLCGYIKHGNKNEFGRIQNERGRGNDTGKAGYAESETSEWISEASSVPVGEHTRLGAAGRRCIPGDSELQGLDGS